MKLVIITGLSGAGKSSVVKCMEDMGYYCVDNLPPALIPKFVELVKMGNFGSRNAAFVVDIRGGSFFDDIVPNIILLKDTGIEFELLFLDCSDESLIKRYKETRRQHPLSIDGRIIDGITLERDKLMPLKELATDIIDTSVYSIKTLKELIIRKYSDKLKSESGLVVSFVSFGFKYGVPLDTDLVFDVRFLPNPYYDEKLRSYTGLRSEVRDFVLRAEETQKFLEMLKEMVKFLLPYYEKEGRRQVVISIGCTGGKHRSVALSKEMYDFSMSLGYVSMIDHRDMHRDGVK